MKFISEKMSRCIVFKGDSSGGTNRTSAVAVNPKQDKLFDPSIDMMVNDFDDEQTLEEEEALAAVEAADPHAELSSLQRPSLSWGCVCWSRGPPVGAAASVSEEGPSVCIGASGSRVVLNNNFRPDDCKSSNFGSRSFHSHS